MSWHYLRELEGESLQDICSGGELLQPLKSKITHAEFYCNGKLMDSYLDSLSGTTFVHLMENLGEEKSMSSRVDFPVRTLVQQEKAQDLTEKGQDFGEKWQGSFTKYSPDTSSWKTHQCLLLGDLEEFSETWPQWGLMRNGECWEQQTLAQTIRGTEYGLSPNGVDSFHTPNTTGLDGGSNSRKALKKKTENWPTPTASQARSEGMIFQMRKMVESGITSIEEAEAMIGGSLTPKRMEKWPTPVTRDYKDTGTQESMTRALNKRDSPGLALMVGAATGGKLNPTWVEWLMGWPLEWTDLKPLEMDKYRSVQQPLGES